MYVSYIVNRKSLVSSKNHPVSSEIKYKIVNQITFSLTLSQTSPDFMCQSFENTMGKGCYEWFLLFTLPFLQLGEFSAIFHFSIAWVFIEFCCQSEKKA